jgi:hypothetical protein
MATKTNQGVSNDQNSQSKQVLHVGEETTPNADRHARNIYDSKRKATIHCVVTSKK